MRKTGLRLGIALLAFAAPALSGAAEFAAAERSAAARALAAEGRCEQALALLVGPNGDDPSDLAAALAVVRCDIRQRRHAEARALLATLRERAPRSGEVHLYTGIVALEAGDHEAALRAFERARELDAARVDPIASYYAGLARAGLGDREGAVADLGRARDLQPGGVWADRATRALARIERSDARRPWRLELTSGIESDDNVVLRGDDIALPEEISDEGDERLMWRVKGSSELLRGGAGALGVSGDYSGTAHLQLEEFDVHYPSAALWWQRPVGERSATRVEYRIGHAWVDGDAFVTSHSLGPTLVHTWQRAGRSTFRARGFGFAYRDEPSDIPDGSGVPGDPCPATTPAGSACGTPGIDESRRRDRTGIGYELFAGHKWSLPWWERAIELKPGFRFQQYLARGSESSHLRLEPDLAARIALPFALFANTDVSYAYRPYQGSSSLPAPGTAQSGVQFQAQGRTRRDQVTRAGVGLEREFFGRVIAELRYSFVDQNSSLQVADYQRHIFGGYMTVRLGK